MSLIEETTNMGFDFNLILISIMQLLNMAINLTIKILVIYIMYLLICALKKYLNNK
ncbi:MULTISPECIES: hypothetical protein [unclassified Romboutsia]|uniref:hypothetical protein n=1 Tax=unclassified Romboutsia TaxID=2626894 RepID=UPI000820CB32|nr:MULTISPECIES: hypothetical protein [unclassified Romboutsia]SCH48197.1 Uncharacterised protein [uncultured Clostridium sp.]